MENREKKKNTTHLCRTKQVTNEQSLVPWYWNSLRSMILSVQLYCREQNIYNIMKNYTIELHILEISG